MSLRVLISRMLPFEKRVNLVSKFLPKGFREALNQLAQIPGYKSSAKAVDDLEVWQYDLRRVAHILEKGLCHPVWTPGHSRPIANELESLLNKVAKEKRNTDPSYIWARSILDEYNVAQQEVKTTRNVNGYDVNSRNQNNDIDSLLRSRRSIRNYKNQQINDDTLAGIIEAINWSSTSCNRQPARVYAVRSPEMITRVMQRFAGSTGFSRNVPCVLVFSADMRAYTMPMEMYLPSIDVSLGVQNCALKAHAEGLSQTLMSWAHHSQADDSGLRKDLGIPEWEQIIMGGALGYPAVTLPPPGRKSTEATAVILD